MLDTANQLARLRARIDEVNARLATRRYTGNGPRPQGNESWSQTESARCFVEEWAQGEVVANEFGEHFETERLYPARKHHGTVDIGLLSDLPCDLLDAIGENQIPFGEPQRWAFLDIETTGINGGSGIYAFLIGVGRITREGFRVRQFFMRECIEERSVLAALASHLSEFDVLVTYNGRGYDQPLLETRFRMTGQPPPFARLPHLDLLHGARRIWKLRLENCRLMLLEQEILGVFREGDVAGELIPYVYFEYLRSREVHRLVPIFHHNAMDILTLGCLTAIVPAAFRSTDREELSRAGIHRGEDFAGIGRWLLAVGEHEKALELLRRAVDLRLPDRLLYRTLWEIALIEKKQKRLPVAIPIFTELAGCSNEYRVPALEELAKYYEHCEQNHGLALEFTNEALRYAGSEALCHRKGRLERRVAKLPGRRRI